MRIGPSATEIKLRKPESKLGLEPGNLIILVENVRNHWTRREVVKNRIVSEGRNIVRDLLGNIGPAPNYIALGTGSTAAADGDIALVAEVFRAPISRRIVTVAAQITYKLFLSTSDANGNTLVEAGLFANTSYTTGGTLLGGRLFARTIFTPIVKDSLTQVTFLWQITVSSTGG